MKRVLAVVGSRDFDDYELLKTELNKLTFDEIVSGGARGADTLGEKYSKEFNIPFKLYSANWNKHGRAAGYLRNRLIADYCNEAIVFWDGSSRGSQHAMICFEDLNRPYKIIRF